MKSKVITLVGSQIIAVLLSFLFNSYLAKTTNPTFVGSYAALTSLITLGPVILGFGVTYSLPILFANAKKTVLTKQYIYLSNFVVLSIGLLSVLLVLGDKIMFGFLEIFNEIDALFILVIIFYVSREVFAQVGKGLSNVSVLILCRLLPPVGLFIGVAVIPIFIPLQIHHLIVLHGFTSMVLLLVINILILPRFECLIPNLKKLLKTSYEYGSYVYFSGFFTVAWIEFIVLYLYYASSPADAATYKIGLLFTTPVIIISQNLSILYFRKWSGGEKIGQNLIFVNLLIVLLAAGIVYLIGEKAIDIFFGVDYVMSSDVMKICLLGAVATALYQLPDQFMNAKAFGKTIFLNTLVCFVTAITSLLYLVPYYGVVGAAWAYSLASIVYLVAISCSYIIYERKRRI